MNFDTTRRKISKNKTLINIYPIPNKNKTRFIFIFIFLISISQIKNLATILLTVRGTGNQQILHFVDDRPFNTIPSQIYVNGILQDYVGNYVYNLEKEINYITIKWNDDIEISSTYKMFYQLTNIIGIDIIDFIMPNFFDSRDMFHGCSNLEIINFYNIDTSKVKDMSEMFEDCSSLVSLNLNRFDVSKVTSFWRTFNGCSNLLSLNLKNFVLTSNAYIYDMFGGHNNNLKLCYDNSKASRFSSVYPSIENNCDELSYMDNTYVFSSDDKPFQRIIII